MQPCSHLSFSPPNLQKCMVITLYCPKPHSGWYRYSSNRKWMHILLVLRNGLKHKVQHRKEKRTSCPGEAFKSNMPIVLPMRKLSLLELIGFSHRKSVLITSRVSLHDNICILWIGKKKIPSCPSCRDFACHPKGCCPPTSTENSLIPTPWLLFMTDHLLILRRIIHRITVLLLHSEELDLPKAIKRKGGGLFPRMVVLNLNEETILKELSHMDKVPQLWQQGPCCNSSFLTPFPVSAQFPYRH